MEASLQQSDSDLPPVMDGQRVTAEAMPHFLPGKPLSLPPRPPVQDVVVQLFSYQGLAEPILVPAVVEPLLVLVLSGAATVEERALDGEWQATEVQAGDFFLTSTSEPYEMRWQVHGDARFEVMHLYLSLPLIEQAARDLHGDRCNPVTFLDVSGAHDERVTFLLEQLRLELFSERQPSPLFVHSLALALAIHLVRTYPDPHNAARGANALQTYKLRRVIETMKARLAEEFCLPHLGQIAGLSDYHFSRLFKRATGLSPSQYFIRLRMARARHLLLETEMSVIEIGMEVGYSSPSHFSQVFRREVGVTPRAYRQM
ncbi:AraC family transcriptional regulator [Pseudomonas stutzeri]|uniref:helix-turn-helix domain-containing protein n=1 Tax=Stutzerimonas stutzeri TaxID=316 RepID=UPI00210D4FF9|nr:AraC family transcriptional regulator [Stutzerimonas stutzeri]MCQ4288224.1 AraC family transcriptional regulator [Stutzerimonas stutzeri]